MNFKSITFEKFYDNYSPMLYGIALQISPSQKQAEELLIKTFEIIYEQKIAEQNQPAICLSLIKLIIRTAQEHFNFMQHQPFRNAPILNLILAEKMTVREICLQNRLSIIQLGKVIRGELNSLRNSKNKNETAYQEKFSYMN